MNELKENQSIKLEKNRIKEDVLHGLEPKYLISQMNELQIAMIDQVANENEEMETLRNCSIALHRVIALLCEFT